MRTSIEILETLDSDIREAQRSVGDPTKAPQSLLKVIALILIAQLTVLIDIREIMTRKLQ